MLDILQYSFFQNAVAWWLLISLIAWFFWVFVIMRKESNITHSISNFLFLGIALSLLLQWNYYLYSFIFAIIASLLIYFLENTRLITNESSKELISQWGIAGWIFTLSLIPTLQLDINSLLFGSILSITHTDLWMVGAFAIIFLITLSVFGKQFLAVTLNQSIAKTKWINISVYNFWFLLLLSIFIALSIKIFWILLIWAFLVIPANSSKIVSNNLKQMFILSVIFSVAWLMIWLLSSYYLETSTWATIVLSLLIIFIIALLKKRL